MKKQEVILLGAGGHARVVAELISLGNEFTIAGFIDDKIKPGTIVYKDKKVLGSFTAISDFKKSAKYFIAAVGNNALREEFFETAKEYFKPLTLIHPFSSVAESVCIGEGTVILAGCVVSSNCKIGANTIINSMVLADHDTIIGDHCHIAQGTVLGSNVYVSSRKFTQIAAIHPSFSKI